MDDLLTTQQVAERLGEKPDTIKHWCQRGLFGSQARKVGDGPRAFWLIPVAALAGFQKPARGRPAKKVDNST